MAAVWNYVFIFLICFVNYLCSSSNDDFRSKPSWIHHKLSHRPATFSQEWQQRLCRTDMDAISGHLDHIAVERVAGTKKHHVVRDYIVKTMESLGYTVETHHFQEQTPVGLKDFYNVIARHDDRARRFLTLACHYDSKDCKKGYCEPWNHKPFTFQAATDSALPCSLMIEVAATLRPYMKQERYKELSLQLVFLDGEEAYQHWTGSDSLYGARALADHWHGDQVTENDGRHHGATSLDQIDVFVLLDLLGAANPVIHNYPQNQADVYAQISQAEQSLKAIPNCLRPIGQIFQSSTYHGVGREGIQDDHIPFLRKGVPVVHLITYPFPTVWHRAEDRREYLDQNTIFNLASVIRLFVAQYLHLDLDQTSGEKCEQGFCNS